MNQPNLGLVGAIAELATRMPGVVGGETGVAYGRAAANAAAKAASKVGEATYNAMKDTTKTEAARKVAGAMAAKRVTANARSSLSNALTSIARDADIVRTRLAALERPPEEKRHIVGAILNHVLNLKSGDKLDLLKQATKTNDTLTLQAVLEVPQYVTGLPPAMLDHYRNHIHMAASPEDVGHLQRLDGSFETICAIDSAMAGLVGQFNTPEVQGLIQTAKAATE